MKKNLLLLIFCLILVLDTKADSKVFQQTLDDEITIERSNGRLYFFRPMRIYSVGCDSVIPEQGIVSCIGSKSEVMRTDILKIPYVSLSDVFYLNAYTNPGTAFKAVRPFVKPFVYNMDNLGITGNTEYQQDYIKFSVRPDMSRVFTITSAQEKKSIFCWPILAAVSIILFCSILVTLNHRNIIYKDGDRMRPQSLGSIYLLFTIIMLAALCYTLTDIPLSFVQIKMVCVAMVFSVVAYLILSYRADHARYDETSHSYRFAIVVSIWISYLVVYYGLTLDANMTLVTGMLSIAMVALINIMSILFDLIVVVAEFFANKLMDYKMNKVISK